MIPCFGHKLGESVPEPFESVAFRNEDWVFEASEGGEGGLPVCGCVIGVESTVASEQVFDVLAGSHLETQRGKVTGHTCDAGILASERADIDLATAFKLNVEQWKAWIETDNHAVEYVFGGGGGCHGEALADTEGLWLARFQEATRDGGDFSKLFVLVSCCVVHLKPVYQSAMASVK